MKQTPLKRKTPLRAKWSPLTKDQQELRQTRRAKPFKARTPANRHPCERRCGRKASTWHHWVDQQTIRRQVPAGQVTATLRDERNLSALCFRCHQDGEAAAGTRRFVADEIPELAWAFASELGEWAVIRLERYPTRGGSAHDEGSSTT